MVGELFSTIAVFGCIIVSITGDFYFQVLCAKGMLSAILASISGSNICLYFFGKSRYKTSVYSNGTNLNFNKAIGMITPVIKTILLFSAVNLLIVTLFHISGVQSLLILSVNNFFSLLHDPVWSGLFYVLIFGFLLFFLILGSYVL